MTTMVNRKLSKAAKMRWAKRRANIQNSRSQSSINQNPLGELPNPVIQKPANPEKPREPLREHSSFGVDCEFPRFSEDFKCPQCDLTFVKKERLFKHVRTHTGKKPHECNVCKKKFRQSGHLTVHTRTHTDEKPLQCQVICPKKFGKNTGLCYHGKRKHSSSPSASQGYDDMVVFGQAFARLSLFERKKNRSNVRTHFYPNMDPEKKEIISNINIFKGISQHASEAEGLAPSPLQVSNIFGSEPGYETAMRNSLIEDSSRNWESEICDSFQIIDIAASCFITENRFPNLDLYQRVGRANHFILPDIKTEASSNAFQLDFKTELKEDIKKEDFEG